MLLIKPPDAVSPETALLTGSGCVVLGSNDTLVALEAAGVPIARIEVHDYMNLRDRLNPNRFATTGTVYVRVDQGGIYQLAPGFVHIPPPLWDALAGQGAVYADLTAAEAQPIAAALGGKLA